MCEFLILKATETTFSPAKTFLFTLDLGKKRNWYFERKSSDYLSSLAFMQTPERYSLTQMELSSPSDQMSNSSNQFSYSSILVSSADMEQKCHAKFSYRSQQLPRTTLHISAEVITMTIFSKICTINLKEETTDAYN
jgi:hypothetical protein